MIVSASIPTCPHLRHRREQALDKARRMDPGEIARRRLAAPRAGRAGRIPARRARRARRAAAPAIPGGAGRDRAAGRPGGYRAAWSWEGFHRSRSVSHIRRGGDKPLSRIAAGFTGGGRRGSRAPPSRASGRVPPSGAARPSPWRRAEGEREQAAAEQHEAERKAPAGEGGGAAARLAALRQRRSPRSARRHAPCRRARRCAAARRRRGSSARCAASAPAATEASPPSPAIASHSRITPGAPLRRASCGRARGSARDGRFGEVALGEGAGGPAHRPAPRRVARQRRDRRGERRRHRCGGTSRPVSPWRTISRQPGVSVAMIGRPHAAASSRAFGSPSP